MQSPTPYSAVLAEERMPGARWFPGAQVNYAHQVFRHVDAAHEAGMPAIVSEDEQGWIRELGWPELKRQVAALALTLRERGVQRGDRVVAYLPNVPETVVAFLACCSIGAVWSVCAPDMGLQAVIDRFRQIEPRVLIAADGIHYAGRSMDRSQVVTSLRAALPHVQTLIVLETPHAASRVADAVRFADTVARDDAATAAFVPEWLPFDHPLWVVYSSGTTGLPKAIVQSHGGVLVTGLSVVLHTDYWRELQQQQPWRTVPLVQLDRLDHVECADFGFGGVARRFVSTTAVRAAARNIRTGACCGASPLATRSPFSAQAQLSTAIA